MILELWHNDTIEAYSERKTFCFGLLILYPRFRGAMLAG
jgi:hypothetical protein